MLRYALLFCLFPPAAFSDTPLRAELIKVSTTPQLVEGVLTGAIYAKTSIALSFRQGGRVVEVRVREGDRVRRGQELARIDALQQEQSLKVAEAAREAAVAAQEQARQAYERQSAMLKRGIGTRAAMDSAEEALSTATREKERIDTQVSRARRALDDTVLRSPQDSVVTARDVEPGQIVSSAQQVLSLAVMESLEAVFQSPDIDFMDDLPGTPVELTLIDGEDEPPMQAEISEIAPLVGRTTGSVAVHARILNPPDDSALLGVPVLGRVFLPQGPGITLPWTALTTTKDGPAVWVVGADSTVSLASIEVERFDTGIFVVSAGLSDGQTVVGAGSQLLYPGRRVVAADGKESAE